MLLSSVASMRVLFQLAYWLYINGFEDEVFAVSRHTPEIPFVRDFRVWSWIFHIWSLEIQMWKQRGQVEPPQALIRRINRYHLLPLPQQTPEQAERLEGRRGSSDLFACPACTYQKETAAASTKSQADAWRLTALFCMTGDGATGLYPPMNEAAEEIEAAVQAYIALLKKN